MKRFFYLMGLCSFLLSGIVQAQVANVVPTVIHFGEQGDNSSSESQQVTVTNLDSVTPLNISTVTFTTGTNFVISNDNCSGQSVAALSTCTFEVAFSPVSIGDLLDTITITDNSSLGSTQTVSVDGTGVGESNVTPSPTSLAFGDEVIGTQSASQMVTITNNGTANLNVIGFVVGGTNPSYFNISSDNCIGQAVAPHATCQFSVVYYPVSNTSSSSAFVSILSDATGEPPQITLTGGATTPFYDGGCSMSSNPRPFPLFYLWGTLVLRFYYYVRRKKSCH